MALETQTISQADISKLLSQYASYMMGDAGTSYNWYNSLTAAQKSIIQNNLSESSKKRLADSAKSLGIKTGTELLGPSTNPGPVEAPVPPPASGFSPPAWPMPSPFGPPSPTGLPWASTASRPPWNSEIKLRARWQQKSD